MYCIHTTKDIVKRFSRPNGPINLVVFAHPALQNFKFNPLGGVLNTRGLGHVVKSCLHKRVARFVSDNRVFLFETQHSVNFL